MNRPDPMRELTVRRRRPEEEDEPDRLPLTWDLIRRVVGLLAPYAPRRNALSPRPTQLP